VIPQCALSAAFFSPDGYKDNMPVSGWLKGYFIRNKFFWKNRIFFA